MYTLNSNDIIEKGHPYQAFGDTNHHNFNIIKSKMLLFVPTDSFFLSFYQHTHSFCQHTHSFFLPAYKPNLSFFLPTHSIFLSACTLILSFFLRTHSIFHSAYIPILSFFLRTHSIFLSAYTLNPLSLPIHSTFESTCTLNLSRSLPVNTLKPFFLEYTHEIILPAYTLIDRSTFQSTILNIPTLFIH